MTSRKVPAREAIPEWLDQWTFTRFVTLATNWDGLSGAGVSDSALKKLRNRLRHWDALINHAILGKHWAERDHDRIFSFYFLEKPGTNPHWHGLIRFFPVEGLEMSDQQRIFDERAALSWKKLVPSGTTDVQPITVQRGVAEYVGKMLGHPLSYENYVVADEFKRG